MENNNLKRRINGISVCNPVDVNEEYLLFTIEYAKEKGFNHIQYTGPIHDGIKGNIDGMILYRKYSRFNGTKDLDYVHKSIDAINRACERAFSYGIKMFAWHHELEMPLEFKDEFPETVNSYGDIEISHPLVKDFLENKIQDFFDTYPKMDGIILTLHETKIPLLKLKNQKLSEIERVKHVTKILYDSCKSLGKGLIVRPFASLEEDYEMMAKAYGEISPELMIMDKWTQFDWSLTLPNNAFYNKIKNNPLVVETDIFGEYFGKGKLPLMLEKHIKEKYNYCENYSPLGYVSRIDRDGQHSFGDVNEINTIIINACINNENINETLEKFFLKKYPQAPQKVRKIMERTEEILMKFMYLNGYYFHQQSLFPCLNHCKNHYYFELMKESGKIDSNEWYIPPAYEVRSREWYLAEKESAVSAAQELLDEVKTLENVISEDEYKKLWIKFSNLRYATLMWKLLSQIIINYVRFFETRKENYYLDFKDNVNQLLSINDEAKELLGKDFYCADSVTNGGAAVKDVIKDFTDEIVKSFEIERNTILEIEKENCIDYIVCGGAMEGHSLQKEVNFSDALIINDALCRIPGNKMGMKWSSINAHGWFSYLLKTVPGKENIIKILMENQDGSIDAKITIGNKVIEVNEKINGKKEFEFKFIPDEEYTRIRFDKISKYTPCIYTIKVL